MSDLQASDRLAVVAKEPGMRILALDLASRTGWALWDGSQMESGVQVFDVRRGESPGMRYVRFTTWLNEMFALKPPELVVYEQTVPTTTKFAGATTREIASGLATRVQEKCAAMGVNHAAVYPSTLKKHVMGRGVGPKSAMIEQVRKRWAPWVYDDNEADAIGLLHYARSVIVGEDVAWSSSGAAAPGAGASSPDASAKPSSASPRSSGVSQPTSTPRGRTPASGERKVPGGRDEVFTQGGEG